MCCDKPACSLHVVISFWYSRGDCSWWSTCHFILNISRNYLKHSKTDLSQDLELGSKSSAYGLLWGKTAPVGEVTNWQGKEEAGNWRRKRTKQRGIKGQDKRKGSLLFGQLDPWRWDRYVVPKRRYQTALHCVTTQNTEDWFQPSRKPKVTNCFRLPFTSCDVTGTCDVTTCQRVKTLFEKTLIRNGCKTLLRARVVTTFRSCLSQVSSVSWLETFRLTPPGDVPVDLYTSAAAPIVFKATTRHT